MRHILPALLLLAVAATSCTKTGAGIQIPDGTYAGTFQRQYAGGGQISTVSLVFSGGQWTGQSQYVQYPGLCNGSFNSIGIDSVHFTNACVWPADFDWSLILSGNYKVSLSGSRLEITRDYSGGYKDIYELGMQ